MNKKELVAAVAGKCEVSKKDAEKVIEAVTSVITDALKMAIKYSLLDSEHLR